MTFFPQIFFASVTAREQAFPEVCDFLAFVQNVITVTIAKEFFTIPRTGKNVSSSLRKMAGYIQRIKMTGLRLVAYLSRDKFNVGVLEPKSSA